MRAKNVLSCVQNVPPFFGVELIHGGDSTTTYQIGSCHYSRHQSSDIVPEYRHWQNLPWGVLRRDPSDYNRCGIAGSWFRFLFVSQLWSGISFFGDPRNHIWHLPRRKSLLLNHQACHCVFYGRQGAGVQAQLLHKRYFCPSCTDPLRFACVVFLHLTWFITSILANRKTDHNFLKLFFCRAMCVKHW